MSYVDAISKGQEEQSGSRRKQRGSSAGREMKETAAAVDVKLVENSCSADDCGSPLCRCTNYDVGAKGGGSHVQGRRSWLGEPTSLLDLPAN
jgi:hypothetical protein